MSNDSMISSDSSEDSSALEALRGRERELSDFGPGIKPEVLPFIFDRYG